MNDDVMRLLVLTNVASTWALVGLIWHMQATHYPLFARIDHEQFVDFHADHVRSTTWVVALPMAAEAATSLTLALRPPSHALAAVCWAGLSLTIALWLSTALLQVPMHKKLATGFDLATHRLLVRSNWIRTIAWSLRGALSICIFCMLPVARLPHGQ